MLTIRHARPADGPAYIALVRALAEFEKLPGPTDEAAERLLEHAFGPHPLYELHVGELDGELIAYAVTFTTYSTFLGKPGLYLEDLFVHPKARRQGIATQILARLRQIATERGYGRFEWTVLDWNTDAQKLYEGIGAEAMRQWVLCRITL